MFKVVAERNDGHSSIRIVQDYTNSTEHRNKICKNTHGLFEIELSENEITALVRGDSVAFTINSDEYTILLMSKD
jgi:hypothetical protein